ncbi:uncharacterized protein LOC124843201 [Vigna umbellata]|uniref:uncharacterized protein LOC124843201 n=1 Tax=Vigna umbellata TaxID=87088 RepID=UPI001F5F7FD0|nr:uncharacterized protein LOC124843201 [Vigna umbellata]
MGDSDSGCKKRVRDDSDDSVLESPETKRLRDDLLEFFDDADDAPSTQDLDSVMKSLQEEISGVTSGSGESQAQIGYLLEASDDELGLPPAGSSSVPENKNEENELIRVASDSSGIGELWEFEDHISRYDSFDLGMGFGYECDTATEYAAFEKLFDHSDVYYDSTEFCDTWRHETLPTQ